MIFLALQQEFLVLRCDAVLARRFWMYSARKQLGNPLWIAKLFEYAVRQNRPSKTDVFLRQCAFALVFFDIQERRRSEERRRLCVQVNYTIKCNTLGEQKEVHTEPW